MNDQNIDTVDFAFQWNTPHTGGYDVAAVEEFMADSLNGVSYKVVVDTEDPVIPEDPGTAEDPAQNPEQPTGNEQNIEKGKPAKTGDSANVALPIVCAAIAGCAAVYAGLRMKRRKV